MDMENRCRLGWLAAGMVTCLMMSSCRTFQEAQAYSDEEDTPTLSKAEKKERVLQIMRDTIIPEVRFAPPDTIIDAVDFFKQASLDYYKPDVPLEQRGLFSFILKLPITTSDGNADDADDIFAPASEGGADIPVISAMTARNISLYDALTLVCEVTGMKLRIDGGLVMIVPKIDEEGFFMRGAFLLTRPFFKEKPNDEVSEAEWKAFFNDCGVSWPEGSSVDYLSTLSKLCVKNTPENVEIMDSLLRCRACEDDARCLFVHTEVQIVAFKAKDIEKLQLGGGVTKQALMGLRKAGKAKTVATASAVAIPEQEALVKTVQETGYPPEPEAKDFTMKDVGMALQVLPRAHWENDTIRMTLRASWITPERRGLFRKPVSNTTQFETVLKVENGDTVLLGSSTAPDGKWVHVGFLTVRRQDVRSAMKGFTHEHGN